MKLPTQHRLGQWAEQQALNFLNRQGFREVAKNFRSRFGEIDLIVQNSNQLVFVEVKARTNIQYGYAHEMVHYSKQRKIIKTAEFFLLRSPQFAQHYCRFDVICFDFHHSVAKNVQQDFSKLGYDQQWIENAFTL